jgi:serine/threonine-protein kinase
MTPVDRGRTNWQEGKRMLEGQQVGAYALGRLLGQGGMSRVYLARDVRLGRDVAVKVLDAQLAERFGFRDRFLREARVAAALDHPHIVPIYDVGEHPLPYLVMPFVSGGSVQRTLGRAPLPPDEAVSYATQVADALGYAHRHNVIHRDVKPANMLIHADGRVMLSDFGLAKIWDGTNAPAPARRPDAGTPEYMAPEQVQGRSGTRSDLYALGVVLYLLLTGRLPFTGATEGEVMAAHVGHLPAAPRTLNARIPPALEAVVLRMLAKQPEDRYPTGAAVSEALLAALILGEVYTAPLAHERAERAGG